MRRPLFIVLIFLLLLRGWVGDAMATGMAAGHRQQVSVAANFVASHAHSERAEGHFGHEVSTQTDGTAVHLVEIHPDCAGHASDQAGEAPSQANGHCESCAACQACNTVALAPLTTNTSSLTLAPALPHSPAAPFASAIAALGQKPPIS